MSAWKVIPEFLPMDSYEALTPLCLIPDCGCLQIRVKNVGNVLHALLLYPGQISQIGPGNVPVSLDLMILLNPELQTVPDQLTSKIKSKLRTSVSARSKLCLARLGPQLYPLFGNFPKEIIQQTFFFYYNIYTHRCSFSVNTRLFSRFNRS